MRPIQPLLHAVLDYTTVVFLLLLASLFPLPPMVREISYALAALQLVLSVCTNYPGGVFKKMPFLLHGYIELVVGLCLVIAGNYFARLEFVASTRIYFSLSGIYLLVFVLTDFRKQVAPSKN